LINRFVKRSRVAATRNPAGEGGYAGQAFFHDEALRLMA